MTASTLMPSTPLTAIRPITCELKGERFPSHGPLVIRWIEKNLVHGLGDLLGQPFKLQPFQKEFLLRLYRIDPATNQRVVKKALLGVPRGNAKTELVAAIALGELLGPLAPMSPDIPIGASAFVQASLLFRTAAAMVSNGPLASDTEVLEKEITPRGGSGRLYRVYSTGRTNQGLLPTCALLDEVHTFELPAHIEMYDALQKGLSKRANTLSICITTAGWDKDSLLGQLYSYGKKIQSGEIIDPSFLFVWYEASEHWDINDPVQLEAAIRESNPVADRFWPVSQRVSEFHSPTATEASNRRYLLNQWADQDDAWIPRAVWGNRTIDRGEPDDGTKIVLGFDGSRTGDTTALIGCTIEKVPHLFVVKLWERPEHAHDDWTVDEADVMQTIRNACSKWNVREVAVDRFLWETALKQLAREHIKIVDFPQSDKRMPQATTNLFAAVHSEGLTHSGDPRLARHISNCVVKIDNFDRPRLQKRDGAGGRNKIDAAVAAVMAFERASYFATKKASPGVINLANYI